VLDYDAFQPYSRLVEITVLGVLFMVPENNILLRCFQYIAADIPYGPWCWNGDCESDRISYRLADDPQAHAGLSCQVLVCEGMQILEISPDLTRFLAPVLAREGATITPASRS